jgi:hypothetical protein
MMFRAVFSNYWWQNHLDTLNCISFFALLTCENSNRQLVNFRLKAVQVKVLFCEQFSLTLLDDRDSIPVRDKGYFSLASVSRPALRPTQPPIQWVPGVLSPGVKFGRDVTLNIHPI